MNFVYGEHLFAPVRLVTLFERAFVLADAHAIRHVQLGHTLTVVSVQTLPHRFLILCIDPRRSHTDAAVVDVVVRSHQVRKDVDVTPRLKFREVAPHARLQRSVESFHDARLRLRVVRGEVTDAAFLKERLNGFIQKFHSPIRLQRLRPVVCERDLQRRGH